jgi:2-polyprenyl-3-methyl-5-hydroxy-6-metoxy-1,4-benzoquinol methylase
MISKMTMAPSAYWEARAQRFAAHGEGLGAVCSYGMPAFYNRYIHFLQARALERWLSVDPGTVALDFGCGVGRWSRRLARSGATVTGIDHSPTMIAEAGRRTTEAGLDARCSFHVADVADLALPWRFDLILGVTVLQHITDDGRLEMALRRLASHLAVDGRIVLIEAAPCRHNTRCDSAIFVARDEAAYHQLFKAAGLRCLEKHAVDPAPFKTWLLPWYRRLPPVVRQAALLAATVGSLPIDVFAERRSADPSWHKLFVLAPDGEAR